MTHSRYSLCELVASRIFDSLWGVPPRPPVSLRSRKRTQQISNRANTTPLTNDTTYVLIGYDQSHRQTLYIRSVAISAMVFLFLFARHRALMVLQSFGIIFFEEKLEMQIINCKFAADIL